MKEKYNGVDHKLEDNVSSKYADWQLAGNLFYDNLFSENLISGRDPSTFLAQAASQLLSATLKGDGAVAHEIEIKEHVIQKTTSDKLAY